MCSLQYLEFGALSLELPWINTIPLEYSSNGTYFCLEIMGKIIFHFEDKTKPSLTFEMAEGDSVLDIAEDNDVELNHNCGGVCACSTCQVYVEKGMDLLQEISDKEEDFIDRARNPKLNSRLGCQCVMEDDGTVEVTIPDQTDIIGHH